MILLTKFLYSFLKEKAVRKYGMIIGMRLHYVLVKTIPNRLLYGAESII